MELGFVGIGRMGSAMALKLVRAGHTVRVWNRTRARAEPLAAEGARLVDSPSAAASRADVVISMLADDAAVASAVLGQGEGAPDPVVAGLVSGAIHVSMSTIGARMSAQLAEAHRARGQRYVAAPVLGKPEAAALGKLVVLAAGDPAAVADCSALFDVLGRETHHLGERPERANVAKLACNFVLVSIFEALGEAFALGESYDVSALRLLTILEESMLSPSTLDAYGSSIARFDLETKGIPVRLGLKDVRLALEAGEDASLAMPLASVLRDRFLVALARGLENKDWAAIARTLPHKRAASMEESRADVH